MKPYVLSIFVILDFSTIKMNINIQVTSEHPQKKRSSVKVEPERDIYLRLNKFVENMSEVRKNSNAHIEEQKNLFRNKGEHSDRQKALNTRQYGNFEDLQQPNKMVKAEFKTAFDDNLSCLKKHYEILQQMYEKLSSTDDGRAQFLKDYIKIKRYYEEQEAQSKFQIEFLKNENCKLRNELASCSVQIDNLKKYISELTEENEKLKTKYEYKCEYNSKDTESLKAVLEMKKNEVAELMKSLYRLTEEVEAHALDKKKISILQAKCEDLEIQLQIKKENEMKLRYENEQLELSVREEIHKRQSLSFKTAELEWKLEHDDKSISKTFEDSIDDKNEKNVISEIKNVHFSLGPPSPNFESTRNDLEDTISEYTLDESHSTLEEDFPPSLTISNLVEKPKSVSYFVRIIKHPFRV